MLKATFTNIPTPPVSVFCSHLCEYNICELLKSEATLLLLVIFIHSIVVNPLQF